MLVTSYVLHLRESFALHTPPFSASLRSTLVRRFRASSSQPLLTVHPSPFFRGWREERKRGEKGGRSERRGCASSIANQLNLNQYLLPPPSSTVLFLFLFLIVFSPRLPLHLPFLERTFGPSLTHPGKTTTPLPSALLSLHASLLPLSPHPPSNSSSSSLSRQSRLVPILIGCSPFPPRFASGVVATFDQPNSRFRDPRPSQISFARISRPGTAERKIGSFFSRPCETNFSFFFFFSFRSQMDR